MKTVILKVDNSNIMRSLERAYLKVSSPSGRSICIHKIKLSKFTAEELELFWKFCKDPMITFQGDVEATIAEMKQLYALSRR